jgi:hypothetical protein
VECFLVLGEGSVVLRTAAIPETSEPCSYPIDSDFVTRFLLLRFFARAESFACGIFRVDREISESLSLAGSRWTAR